MQHCPRGIIDSGRRRKRRKSVPQLLIVAAVYLGQHPLSKHTLVR